MKGSNLRIIADTIFPFLKSGRVTVSLEGEKAFSAEFSERKLLVSLDKPRAVRRLNRTVPWELKRISYLKYASEILSEAGVVIEVFDHSGVIIEMGLDRHGSLGKLEIKTIRVLRYI
jgi:hypothetical protein